MGLAWANDTSIFLVTTVVLVFHSWTIPQVLLSASAVQLVQVDGSSARGKLPPLTRHAERVAAAVLGTHHVCIPQVPLVITHRAPRPVSPHLHPSGTAVRASGQTQKLVTWKQNLWVLNDLCLKVWKTQWKLSWYIDLKSSWDVKCKTNITSVGDFHIHIVVTLASKIEPFSFWIHDSQTLLCFVATFFFFFWSSWKTN